MNIEELLFKHDAVIGLNTMEETKEFLDACGEIGLTTRTGASMSDLYDSCLRGGIGFPLRARAGRHFPRTVAIYGRTAILFGFHIDWVDCKPDLLLFNYE